jgi:hypothetical protein
LIANLQYMYRKIQAKPMRRFRARIASIFAGKIILSGGGGEQ